jgi:hypothetical protein
MSFSLLSGCAQPITVSQPNPYNDGVIWKEEIPLNTGSIIQEIDLEISRLEQAKAILSGTAVKRSPGRPKQTQAVLKTVAIEPTKRLLSAEARARIAAAQKLRWAKSRRAAKKAVKKAVVKSVPAKKAPVKKAAPVKSSEIKA